MRDTWLDVRSGRIKEIGIPVYLPKRRIKLSRSAKHARERSRGRTAAVPKVARDLVGRTYARTHACACRSRIFFRPAASRPLTHTCRRFVITAGSHGRICIFPRWLSVRQRRHLHPTRHDSARRERNRVRSRSASECKTHARAELWGAGTPTSWSSNPTHTDASHPGAVIDPPWATSISRPSHRFPPSASSSSPSLSPSLSFSRKRNVVWRASTHALSLFAERFVNQSFYLIGRHVVAERFISRGVNHYIHLVTKALDRGLLMIWGRCIYDEIRLYLAIAIIYEFALRSAILVVSWHAVGNTLLLVDGRREDAASLRKREAKGNEKEGP